MRRQWKAFAEQMLKTSEMTSNSNVTWFARTNRARFFWFLLHVWFRWKLGEKVAVNISFCLLILGDDTYTSYLLHSIQPLVEAFFFFAVVSCVYRNWIFGFGLSQAVIISIQVIVIHLGREPQRSQRPPGFFHFRRRFVLAFTLHFYLEGIHNTPNVWCM